MLSNDEKRAAFEAVRDRVKLTVPPELLYAACFYWARHGMYELTKRTGARVLVQAGSCAWRYRTDEAAGTEGNTHYGYQWGYSPASIASVACGNLPESHIWLAVLYDENPEANEIVDFSAGLFVEAARRHDIAWELPPPPDYLWLRASDSWPEAQYKPDVEACVWVNSILRRLKGRRPTQDLLASCVRDTAADYYAMAARHGVRVNDPGNGVLTIVREDLAAQASFG